MSDRSDTVMSWTITVFSGWYLVWTTYSLSRRVDHFGQLFRALGATLPVPTRAALTFCRPGVLWPLCGVTLAVLIIKELMLASTRSKVLVSTAIFMATACTSSLLTELLFQPLFDLIRKIG